MAEGLKYQNGFGNHFSTEALPGTLPAHQNSPQQVAHGLYAEQLSGSAFTAPRHENLRTWFYRIRPSVLQGAFREVGTRLIRSGPVTETAANPTPLRWDALAIPQEPTDFFEGLVTLAASGDVAQKRGGAAHLYVANRSMEKRFVYNADGEWLIVPQEGRLLLRTECGAIEIGVGEVAVVPRGMKFQAEVPDGKSRGYVCENYGSPFRLPQLGPIGANGLANPRDFETPVAAFEDSLGEFSLLAKFQGKIWEARLGHSPLDVVAWHGNYVPYKYNLKHFNTIGTVSFDHPDPSIFTVLHSPSEFPGTANLDFVIFPPRWMVAEHTFRPPYYHRNAMSEFMGLLYGVYDAKGRGCDPGGSSLHNVMSPHGPDAEAFEKASHEKLTPQYIGNTMAIMFESGLALLPTSFAASGPLLQKDYLDCWKGLKSHFPQKGGKNG